MFRNLLKNTNKKTVAFSATLFVVFSVLIYLFPFSEDDWAWGSQIGLDRLANNFDNYNNINNIRPCLAIARVNMVL